MENPSVTPVPDMGIMDRIINVFTSPAELFTFLIARPTWAFPFLLMITLGLTNSILLKEVIQKENIRSARESMMKSEMSDSQKEAQIEQMTIGMAKMYYVFAIPGVIIVFLIVYFGSSLGLWLGGKWFLKSDAGYMQVLSIFSYATLIDILGGLLKSPIMYLNQTMRVDTGLGVLMGEEAVHTWQYTLLSRFDVFTFWMLSVLIIGLMALFKSSKGKTATMVIGMWLVVVLVAVGLAAMKG